MGLASSPIQGMTMNGNLNDEISKNVKKISRHRIRMNANNAYKSGIVEHNPKIKGMSISIKNFGIIQPLIIRELNDEEKSSRENPNHEFEIIDGNRRFFASSLIENYSHVECIVLDEVSYDRYLALQISSNEISRDDEDFNPLEQSYAYHEYLRVGCPDFDGDSPAKLAEHLGLERTKVNRILLLEQLDQRIKRSCVIERYHNDDAGDIVHGYNLNLAFLTKIRVLQEKKGTNEAIRIFNEKLREVSDCDPRIIDHEIDEDSSMDIKNWNKNTYDLGQKNKASTYMVVDLKVLRGVDVPVTQKDGGKKKIEIKIPYDMTDEEICESLLKTKNLIRKGMDGFNEEFDQAQIA